MTQLPATSATEFESSEIRTLLNLLDSQLRILHQWRDRGADFVRALEKPGADTAQNLDRFLSERDRLLEVVTLFDRKITEYAAAIPTHDRSPLLAHAIQGRLVRGQALLQETAEQDEAIRHALSARVAELARDAALAHRSRQLLAKFKSQQSPLAGEEVDSHR